MAVFLVPKNLVPKKRPELPGGPKMRPGGRTGRQGSRKGLAGRDRQRLQAKRSACCEQCERQAEPASSPGEGGMPGPTASNQALPASERPHLGTARP